MVELHNKKAAGNPLRIADRRSGAGNGIRTRDIQLGKLTLYH